MALPAIQGIYNIISTTNALSGCRLYTALMANANPPEEIRRLALQAALCIASS
jgi:hypothetical protein